MPRPARNHVERFNEKVNKDGPTRGDMATPCWEWTGRVNSRGYGRLLVGGARGKLHLAHRLAYEMQHGPIPMGMSVCHACDNPRCVRESHLFLGTHQDNMKDKELKGRGNHARGESSGAAKLRSEDVLQIRAMAARGETSRSIAPLFGVSHTAVINILRGRTWCSVKIKAER